MERKKDKESVVWRWRVGKEVMVVMVLIRRYGWGSMKRERW